MDWGKKNTACESAKEVRGEVRDGAERKAGRYKGCRWVSRWRVGGWWYRGGQSYLVCTMAISGLILPPHLREPLLSPARLGQSIAAHSAWGMELHLIQLWCHSLFTHHTHSQHAYARTGGEQIKLEGGGRWWWWWW